MGSIQLARPLPETEEVDSSNLQNLNTTGFMQLTVSSTAVALPALNVFQPVYALVQCETANVRYTLDGTTPTASIGMLLVAGSAVEVWGNGDIGRFRAIRVSVDGQLNVSYAR